jgi:predicted nucleotidyltransferase component of viral defense system
MISKRFITQWLENAPWPNMAQVEQDLIISRALVNIFNNEILRSNLVFRGGTALTKLFLNSAMRYSEDIDLVQYKAGSIGVLMTELHNELDPWLGKPKYKQTQGRVTLYYRFETENYPVKKMKLKIEINTREHGSELDLLSKPFSIENGWFSDKTIINTYALEELTGTKLRALYQRRKGRDLFDLYQILSQKKNLDTNKVVNCFQAYLNKEKLSVSKAEFEKNMYYKLKNPLFIDDLVPLLANDTSYNQNDAYDLVYKKIISLLPGESWANNG